MADAAGPLPDPVGGGLSIREHLTASDCQTPNRPLMVAKHAGIGQAIIFRPNCKQWKCEYCSRQRSGWFAVLAAYGHEELTAKGDEIMFWTITSHAKIRTLDRGIFVWRSAWPKLRKRLQRVAKNVSYFYIPEQHKDGSYHVHLLTSGKVTERWCKDNSAKTGLGYMSEYEPVRTAHKAAWYASKYLTKESHLLDWPKFFRRVNTSRNWPRPDPLEKNEHWAVMLLNKTYSVEAHKTVLEAQGMAVSAFTT